MNKFQESYQRQAIMHASPALLIGKLFDFAILSSHKSDMANVDRIMAELMRCLDPDDEAAAGFFQLFHYCRQINFKKKHNEVILLLEPIRDTWYDVMVRSTNATMALPSAGRDSHARIDT